MAEKLKIYLASPYTHDEYEIIQERFMLACRAAAKLMRNGYIVFSPIAHSHSISFYAKLSQFDHEFWFEQNKAYIEWCDELWILDIDGNRESKGIQMEKDYAAKLSKPIKYTE